MKETFNRVARTVIQLVAAGGLTALTTQVSHDLPVAYAPYILIGYTVLVTACQNYAEDAGWIKPVLKGNADDTEQSPQT